MKSSSATELLRQGHLHRLRRHRRQRRPRRGRRRRQQRSLGTGGRAQRSCAGRLDLGMGESPAPNGGGTCGKNHGKNNGTCGKMLYFPFSVLVLLICLVRLGWLFFLLLLLLVFCVFFFLLSSLLPETLPSATPLAPRIFPHDSHHIS